MEDENYHDGQNGFAIPSTPMSRIPQPATKVAGTGLVSPLNKRNQSSDVLGELRQEVTNMAPPRLQMPMSAVRKSTSIRPSNGPTMNNAVSVLNAARKPATGENNDRRTLTAASRKPTSSVFPGVTKSSARPKSASAIRPTSRDVSTRPQSAQGYGKDLFNTERILPVNKNIGTYPWDMKGRVETMEAKFEELSSRMFSEQNVSSSKIDELRNKVVTLENEKALSDLQCRKYQDSVSELQQKVRSLLTDIEDQGRRSRIEKEDLERTMKLQMEEAMRVAIAKEDDLVRQHRMTEEHWKLCLTEKEEKYRQELSRSEAEHNTEKARLLHQLSVQEAELRVQYEAQCRSLQSEIEKLKISFDMDRASSDSAIAEMRMTLSDTEACLQAAKDSLEAERRITISLKNTIAEQTAASMSIESASFGLQSRIKLLEGSLTERDSKLAEMECRLKEALKSDAEIKAKLLKEETLRRVLHNQVQELKGNIRVFCRVRPPRQNETDVAEMVYPDSSLEGRELEITGPGSESALGSAMGTVTTKTHAFAFDKVFPPASTNREIFDEISQLVQSALDGYNVCIFCYGQTGSGKTYTMSSEDGMISRAVDQIYTCASALKEKGWTYEVTGQFLEIYNENINDLLVDSDDFDKKKLEIRNDLKENKIVIPDLTTISLESCESVLSMLRKASSNRSVAATKANERSSRSHSVFILSLRGTNMTTNEKREGTLNLIDLAGSERLSQSQSTGDRLKETVSINKSLSCLRDVITALGSAKDGAHIPYRNSKLTYLLQYSLGGNSKTLMFVNISPLRSHIPETVNSLRFATKVNNTHIGTARRK